MTIYQRVFNIKNKSYQLTYLAQIYYQLHHSMKFKTLLLCSKSLYNIPTYSKPLSIKVNYHLISIFLYHKTYKINKTINHNNNSPDINLQIDFSMHWRTNIGLVALSQLLLQSLLFANTQKNLYNLISYSRIRTSLVGQEIILYLN